METKERMQIVKDIANKKITLTRLFDAPVDQVWTAWTEVDYLNQWWAPEPWHAETRSMDFREGGKWIYAMVSPEGEKHWAILNYSKISKGKFFECRDSFCEEDGTLKTGLPTSHWHVEFGAAPKGTKVTITMTFDNEVELKQIVEMGFEQGITMTLSALERYLKKVLNCAHKIAITKHLALLLI